MHYAKVTYDLSKILHRKFFQKNEPNNSSYIKSSCLINYTLVIIVLSRKAEFTYYVIIFMISRIMNPVVTKKIIVLWPPKYFTVI